MRKFLYTAVLFCFFVSHISSSSPVGKRRVARKQKASVPKPCKVNTPQVNIPQVNIPQVNTPQVIEPMKKTPKVRRRFPKVHLNLSFPLSVSMPVSRYRSSIVKPFLAGLMSLGALVGYHKYFGSTFSMDSKEFYSNDGIAMFLSAVGGLSFFTTGTNILAKAAYYMQKAYAHGKRSSHDDKEAYDDEKEFVPSIVRNIGRGLDRLLSVLSWPIGGDLTPFSSSSLEKRFAHSCYFIPNYRGGDLETQNRSDRPMDKSFAKRLLQMIMPDAFPRSYHKRGRYNRRNVQERKKNRNHCAVETPVSQRDHAKGECEKSAKKTVARDKK